CDFGPDLAQAVARGRRAEFGKFERFRDPGVRASIPDPNAEATFAASKLEWSEAGTPNGVESLEFYRRCLAVRHEYIVPRLSGLAPGRSFDVTHESLLRVRWELSDGSTLHARVNFGSASLSSVEPQAGTPLYQSDAGIAAGGTWPAYSSAFSLETMPA
ncbi:MAG: DUF3459 domain-containing protein, partial [Burkholderiaceae bacterium]